MPDRNGGSGEVGSEEDRDRRRQGRYDGHRPAPDQPGNDDKKHDGRYSVENRSVPRTLPTGGKLPARQDAQRPAQEYTTSPSATGQARSAGGWIWSPRIKLWVMYDARTGFWFDEHGKRCEPPETPGGASRASARSWNASNTQTSGLAQAEATALPRAQTYPFGARGIAEQSHRHESGRHRSPQREHRVPLPSTIESSTSLSAREIEEYLSRVSSFAARHEIEWRHRYERSHIQILASNREARIVAFAGIRDCIEMQIEAKSDGDSS